MGCTATDEQLGPSRADLAVSVRPEFPSCAKRTVEDHLIVAVVVEIDKVALPAARFLVSASTALDADKLGCHQ
jgi:hypothetical protein